MDRPAIAVPRWFAPIEGFPQDIEQSAKRGPAGRHHDGPALARHRQTSRQPFGRGHRDGAHAVEIEMMSHLEHDCPGAEGHPEGLVDRGQRTVELDLDDRSPHRRHPTRSVPSELWPLAIDRRGRLDHVSVPSGT